MVKLIINKLLNLIEENYITLAPISFYNVSFNNYLETIKISEKVF